MSAYFLDVNSSLEYVLGKDVVEAISDRYTGLDTAKIAVVKSMLFPSQFNPYDTYLDQLERFILNDEGMMFKIQLQTTTNQWFSFVAQWIAQEEWASSFIDNPYALFCNNDRFNLRVKQLRDNTLALVQNKSLNLYHHKWSALKQLQAFNQPIKPSDMSFFLRECSYQASLRNLVVCEWIRNVGETCDVNNIDVLQDTEHIMSAADYW